MTPMDTRLLHQPIIDEPVIDLMPCGATADIYCSKVADQMKVHGVDLGQRLTFEKQVMAVAGSCNYHAQAILHIRHLLTTELA